MKKQLAIILMALPLMAQAEEVGDTTFTYGNKQIVVADVKSGVDVTVLTKDGDEYRKVMETEFVDDKEITQVYVTSPFIPKKKSKQFYGHIPALSYGLSTISGGVLSFDNSDVMHPNSSKSWEFAITPVDVAIPFNKQRTFGMSMGVQVVWARNYFSDGHGLYKDDGIVTVRPIDELGEGEKLKKSYLSHKALRFPMFFEFQKPVGNSEFFATLGASLEWRFSERSRVKTNHNTFTPTKDININPIGLNLEAQVGFSEIAIFVRTALTPLMKTNCAPKAYPTSIGIGIGL